MEQTMYLLDNQYHPEVIDKMYNAIRERTWAHCVKTQETLCRHQLYSGTVTDFVQDATINTKYGFPDNSYTYFLPQRILTGNQKYILDKYIRNSTCVTLREMLQNSRFTSQWIFHIADYVYMNLSCMILQGGTYLVIHVDTDDGITQDMMDYIMSNYDNDYAENRWILEARPKVSYGYSETVYNSIIEDGKLYLDIFTESKHYLDTSDIPYWKIGLSDRSSDPNLLRLTSTTIQTDDRGRYLQLSDEFQDYIADSGFAMNCFVYNEARMVGNATTINYIGPTQYLNTVFSEPLATILGNRIKVVSMKIDGSWTTVAGTDTKLGFSDDLVAVGFEDDECWIAVPTQDGVSPVNPLNFRVWEYDTERDTIGRMVACNMRLEFPNVYYYSMTSESSYLYIEWFRDDITNPGKYDDFSKDYRDYTGSDFYQSMTEDNLPDAISTFEPTLHLYDTMDFIHSVIMESGHEYRVNQMTELLNETGMSYVDLYTAIAAANKRYTTYVFDMSALPDMYASIQATGQIVIERSTTSLAPYDIYIDGIRINNTSCQWSEFQQIIGVDTSKVSSSSIIIIDTYESCSQGINTMDITGSISNQFLPDDFVMTYTSSADLVVTSTDGIRFANTDVDYAITAKYKVCQVSVDDIDWDALGFTYFDNEDIFNRISIDPTTGFTALTFTYIDFSTYVPIQLTTSMDEILMTLYGQTLVVNDVDIVIDFDSSLESSIYAFDTEDHSDGEFSKRILTSNLAIDVSTLTTGDSFRVCNANVHRKGTAHTLGSNPIVAIPNFYGAADSARILGFVDGVLAAHADITPEFSEMVPGDVNVTFGGSYTSSNTGDVSYLPFAVDRFEVQSDEYCQLDLAGSGIMCIIGDDMVFEAGKRIPTSKLTYITNQKMIAPSANTRYTVVRVRRDSNMFAFDDTYDQSFTDKLIYQSPGFKAYLGLQ